MRLHRLGFLFLPFREYKENGDGRPASPCAGGSDRPWDQLARGDGRGISSRGPLGGSSPLTRAIGDRTERTDQESPLTGAIRKPSDPLRGRCKGSDREGEGEIPFRRPEIPFWRSDKGSGRVRSQRESGEYCVRFSGTLARALNFSVCHYFGVEMRYFMNQTRVIRQV